MTVPKRGSNTNTVCQEEMATTNGKKNGLNRGLGDR